MLTTIIECDSELEWLQSITQNALNIIQAKKSANKIANIALTGGKTPVNLYKHWASVNSFSSNINWWIGDERCVEKNSENRNENLIMNTLATAAWFNKNTLQSWGDECDSAAAALIYEQKLREALKSDCGSFDLILLGLGNDGHIASLFPGSEELFEQNKLCAHTSVEHAGFRRLTFTFPLLNKAKEIFFIVTGTQKQPIIEELREFNTSIPAGMLAGPKQTLFWLK